MSDASLVTGVTCRSCGAATVAGARFCATCGQPLMQRNDERRVVTVLFADLVGYTTLAERLDPEQVKNTVDRCFERLAADVADFGGRVDKIVGDAILALFGAPLAHEDDAERAVRCALRMQRTLADWREGTGAGVLQMRVGINTGEVLVGALRAAGDWTAMGDVVNTASRLQTLALPGTVVVGADTHAATAEAVRYTPLGELHAKGREALVEAWVAEEPIALPGRRARRDDVPIVGRDLELGLLGHFVSTAVQRRRAATVVVVAEAGMGKTRLVEAVAERAACDHDVAVWEGRCVPYGEANVWWPVAEALRSAMGAPLGTPPDTTRHLCIERVRGGMPEATEAEIQRVADGLLHLLGEPGPLAAIDPQRAKDEVLRAIVAHLEAWARVRPIVVLLSDVHWADDVVLELGQRLAERGAGLPVVLMYTARSSLLERWEPKVGRHNVAVVHLDALDREASGALLDHLACDLPADLRELVLDRSGGNPFFLEELVALLGEGAGRTGVPHTLRGLVSARLDGLPDLERQVLEDASILGRRFNEFSITIMCEKTRDVGGVEVARALSGLVDKDLLSVEGDIYEFRSELVREVAYGTLTKSDRIKGHYGVASWIETHPSGTSADTERVAHHLATAAELALELGDLQQFPADLQDKAIGAIGRAVDAALAAELHNHAHRLATQALDLADAAGLDAGHRLRFVLARARSSTSLRDLVEAEVDLATATGLAEETGDPVLAADVLVRRGDLEQKRGDLDASLTALDSAIAIYREAGDVRGTAEALLLAGTCHIFAGADELASAAFTEALDDFRALGDRRGEGWAVQNLAWVAYSAGRIAEADARCAESVSIFNELGDRGGLTWAIGMQAYVRFHQARWAEAEELCESLLVDAEDRGDPWALGMMLGLRGSLRLWTGRASGAVEPAEQARERFESMGDWYGQLLAGGVLGRALVSLGRFDDAFDAIDRTMVVASGTSSTAAPHIATTHYVTSAAQAGRPDRLVGVELAPVQVFGHHAGEVGFTDCLIGDGLLHLQRGDASRAVALLDGVADELGEAASGYGLSALALARSAAGDVDGARAAATAASSLATATYLDRANAAFAQMLASARAGDGAGADAGLQSAKDALEGTEDRLAHGLLTLAQARADAALGRPVAPGAGSEAAQDSPGWDVAFRLAAGLER